MKRLLLSSLFLFGMVSVSLQADTLDWDSVNWSNEELTETYTINGVDVTVTISGTTSGLEADSPNDTTDLNGSGSGQTLFLNTNHSNNTNAITVTITFSTGVTNISFTLFDIDEDNSSYTDQIRNVSSTNGTSTYYATATGNANTTVSGSGTSTLTVNGNAPTNDDSDASNATFSFSGNTVNSLTFTYGNDPSQAPGNPGNQWIGLGDITYTVVPEPSTYLSASFLLVFLGWQTWRKRRSTSAS